MKGDKSAEHKEETGAEMADEGRVRVAPGGWERSSAGSRHCLKRGSRQRASSTAASGPGAKFRLVLHTQALGGRACFTNHTGQCLEGGSQQSCTPTDWPSTELIKGRGGRGGGG